jgi:hypothetical protein
VGSKGLPTRINDVVLADGGKRTEAKRYELPERNKAQRSNLKLEEDSDTARTDTRLTDQYYHMFCLFSIPRFLRLRTLLVDEEGYDLGYREDFILQLQEKEKGGQTKLNDLNTLLKHIFLRTIRS